MEYGAARVGNGPHLMVKNFVQFSIAMIFYWFLGFGFSFRDTRSDFIGQDAFGGKGWLDDYTQGNGECFSFYGLLGIFVIYIINLSISERTHYYFYVFFPALQMVFVWPVVLAWIYGNGWLVNAIEDPILDYGSDITVFVYAGAFALVAAIFVGKRPGRFVAIAEINREVRFEGSFIISNPPVFILGCFLTILGVFGIAVAQQPNDVARANSMHNLWISGAASALVSLKLVTMFQHDLKVHYVALYQGFIAGMVVIASSAGNTSPWEAGLIGILNGAVFWFGYKLVRWVKIDDAADVVATFLLPGIIGGILPGFLDEDVGVFWAGWESGQTLGTQTVGTFVVLCWSLFWALVVVVPFKLLGILRMHEELVERCMVGSTITQRGYTTDRKHEAH